MRSFPVRAVALVAASILFAGCGGSDSDQSSSPDGSASTASLEHVDGTVRTVDGAFEVTPKGGGEPMRFTYGPEVEQTQVRALEAAGATARVTWRETDGKPVAAAVVEAPRLEEGLERYEGTVVSVSSSEVTIKGAAGERTFAIADPATFDVHHLEEHRDGGAPVVVHYRSGDGAGAEQAVAYEDA